ncbi:hypothetical protein OG539_07800 [Actinacidiphila glaucinigra]|nr:hypothetical protein [Actinacidiphila glaucinigra]WSD63735.1 hypothetical protein OIE69_35015 [Actinacidiphila glaucinigra]
MALLDMIGAQRATATADQDAGAGAGEGDARRRPYDALPAPRRRRDTPR